MKQKYAFWHVGEKRVTLTRKEAHAELDKAFDREEESKNIQGFSITLPLTKEEAEHERKFYDTLNKNN